MKNFSLTPQEIAGLRIAHRHAKQRKAADRIKAVLLLGTGWSNEKVCEALLLEDDTLRAYVNQFKEGGVRKLLETHYKGRATKLTHHEMDALSNHLEKTTYLTVEAIVAYVEATYEISYSVSGMTELLHRIGFTYKKAKQVPAKADRKKQETFLKELEVLRENKGENDPILYMDGVHPQHNTQLAYGWIKKGKDAIIKSNTGRQRININGALDAASHDVIVREDKSINADSTVELLKTVEAAYPLAVIIYMICDNASYYRSKQVKAFLEHSKVELVFLPSYSPNLNLIERLWKHMKKELLYNQYYEKFDAFKSAVMGFFDNIEEHKDKLASLLTNNFQLLDASGDP